MTRVKTFEEAQMLRRQYPLRAATAAKLRDAMASLLLWHRHYFGIEPRSTLQGVLYRYKLKKALKQSELKRGATGSSGRRPPPDTE